MFNFILDNIHIGIALYLILLSLLILANKRFWDMIGKDDRDAFSLGSIKTGRLSSTTPNRSNIPKSRDEAPR